MNNKKITFGLVSAGCIDKMHAETNYGYDQQVEVLGSKGSIRAQNRRPTSVVLSSKDGVFMDQPFYSFVERCREAYIAELKGFINCLEIGGRTTVDGLYAMQPYRLL